MATLTARVEDQDSVPVWRRKPVPKDKRVYEDVVLVERAHTWYARLPVDELLALGSWAWTARYVPAQKRGRHLGAIAGAFGLALLATMIATPLFYGLVLFALVLAGMPGLIIGAAVGYFVGTRFEHKPLWAFRKSGAVLSPIMPRELLQHYIAGDRDEMMAIRGSYLAHVHEQRAIKRLYRMRGRGLAKLQFGALMAVLVAMSIMVLFLMLIGNDGGFESDPPNQPTAGVIQ